MCVEARCPNRGECSAAGTATFLILGRNCTRSCAFCAVSSGPGRPPDPEEPHRVAKSAQDLGLSHVVVTSVTRDDLPDGGASMFAEVIRAVRAVVPGASIEALIPDLRGSIKALDAIILAEPQVIGHNIETTPPLYPIIRQGADYLRSMGLLRAAKDRSASVITKSGVMVGLGETRKELCAVFGDLHRAGVSMVTIGQYLRPTRHNIPVARRVPPAEFIEIAEDAYAAGIPQVTSGPLVRSSYRAKESFLAACALLRTP